MSDQVRGEAWYDFETDNSNAAGWSVGEGCEKQRFTTSNGDLGARIKTVERKTMRYRTNLLDNGAPPRREIESWCNMCNWCLRLSIRCDS